ncbi:MAG: class A beta-lactamase-related serine hydrolase [Deltaproteobacteria bacterium]|nr:MAG: class A beta-lactamase-related serine hydrolase [Deltaproteobacteria bacterium]
MRLSSGRGVSLDARVAASLFLVACAGGEPSATDDREETGDPGTLDTGALQALLDEALPEAPAGVEGLLLVVHADDGRRLFTLRSGQIETTDRLAMASASKLVSSLVFLRLVEEGALALDDTAGDVLGWTGDHGAITADALGAFASGLPGDAPCTLELQTPLADCVATFPSLALLGAPGEVFDYGPTHQHALAAMAQARTGETWAQLFDTRLASPLGLADDELRYVTYPQAGLGQVNPLVAGGLLATVDEYAEILGLFYRRGELDGRAHIAGELVDRMGRNAYPDATLANSPMALYGYDARYGFGAWLECPDAPETCAIVSSPGAFGTTPWVEREHGYYAILAMEASTTGAAGFSMGLTVQLRPLIEELVE